MTNNLVTDIHVCKGHTGDDLRIGAVVFSGYKDAWYIDFGTETYGEGMVSLLVALIQCRCTLLGDGSMV